jgi:hypothetical protein
MRLVPSLFGNYLIVSIFKEDLGDTFGVLLILRSINSMGILPNIAKEV